MASNKPLKKSSQELPLVEISKHLVNWFNKDKRGLPWRKSKDPYFVWISEIMLQQTTTQAVRPYFKRFIGKWPDVNSLANASQEEVNEHWAGLGYYSRARNILKAAKLIKTDYNGTLPKSAAELIHLPGIGPYTSRAISSICFGEKVGVVDGNVLRVHNRLLGKKVKWWKKDFHQQTQDFSNKLCNLQPPSIMNSALMDLGSTVCTPKKVMCSLCPLTKSCKSFKNGLQETLPLPKPRKEKEHWSYTVYKNELSKKSTYTAQAKEINSPILTKNILPIGKFKKLDEKPKTYEFMHSITNHNIYIKFAKAPKKLTGPKPQKISRTRLKQATPSSLIEKIWQHPKFYESI